MEYSIKEMSEKTGLSIPTLRFYDKERLFPNLERKSSNYRTFTDSELDVVKIIKCFKKAGLSLKEIKHYMELVKEGPATFEERLKMMQEQLELLLREKEELEKSISLVKRKIMYYDEAVKTGVAPVFSTCEKE